MSAAAEGQGDAPAVADGRPTLIPALPQHRFETARLETLLDRELPGYRGPLDLLQFQGGQSNPTYLLRATSGDYVLRKKPPGTLLPSAHAVDREFAVLRALAQTGVPVPPVHLLCRDDAVIGQWFYVMDYLPGRVFADRTLPSCTPDERAAMHADMARVLALLHQVDVAAVGLAGFGRTGQYVERQVARWSKQYYDSQLGDVPEMDSLVAWLRDHPPIADETTLVHGDYRLGNLLFHPTEPRIIAVLDWELSTLGHPLADLAYNCLSYHLPLQYQGLKGAIPAGMPSEADYVADYCRRVGRPVPDMSFFVAFSLFRWAAIAAGVYKRALDGNAADRSGIDAGRRFRELAVAGWRVAQGGS